MRKWSPEAFDLESAGATVVRGGGEPFTPLGGELADRTGDRRFRSERGFGDPAGIMDQITPEERALICDLVEQDVAREYRRREEELRRELESAHAAALAEVRAAQQAFAAAWQEQHDHRLQGIADAAARLALQLAAKLVRREIAAEPAALARTLETVFYGAGARGPLTVTVHPDDAAWLEDQPELRERLRIGDVVADRRVDRGGCVVAADGREWDATLAGQLETLGEVVEEWLTTAGRGGPEPEAGA